MLFETTSTEEAFNVYNKTQKSLRQSENWHLKRALTPKIRDPQLLTLERPRRAVFYPPIGLLRNTKWILQKFATNTVGFIFSLKCKILRSFMIV